MWDSGYLTLMVAGSWWVQSLQNVEDLPTTTAISYSRTITELMCFRSALQPPWPRCAEREQRGECNRDDTAAVPRCCLAPVLRCCLTFEVGHLYDSTRGIMCVFSFIYLFEMFFEAFCRSWRDSEREMERENGGETLGEGREPNLWHLQESSVSVSSTNVFISVASPPFQYSSVPPCTLKVLCFSGTFLDN